MFNPLNLREDTGKIWENYIISEFHKKREYERLTSGLYFWRTYDKKEIDSIQEQGGGLCGYEIKWKQERARALRDWRKYYPDAEFKVIHRENYLKYILKSEDYL